MADVDVTYTNSAAFRPGSMSAGACGDIANSASERNETRARLLWKSQNVNARREHRLYMGVLGSLAVTMDMH